MYKNIDMLLNKLAQEIDIPDSLFELAEKRYISVGEWLNRDNSYLNKIGAKVDIYPHGSAKLGTMIKPTTNNDEFDIDVVCEIKNVSKLTSTQKQVKETLGKDIKSYAIAHNMVNDPHNGKRCWTINYHENAQFHMDFLGAIPDHSTSGIYLESHMSNEIKKVNQEYYTLAITDKSSPVYEILSKNWNISNPKGYFNWFKDKMIERYKIYKEEFALESSIDIEAVPDYKIKTSLQKSIQILKRHRDIYFKENSDYKVSSIIITTLVAHTYQNNPSIYLTLRNAIQNMSSYIRVQENKYYISNPVDSEENFADKWNKDNNYCKFFFRWLEQLKSDFFKDSLLNNDTFKDTPELRVLKENLGSVAFENAYGKFLKDKKSSGSTINLLGGLTSIASIPKPYGGDKNK
ncbi:cyclic GMP-AMP synthase DncV-like nucleotidyltransferase [Cetobacterium sp.]|uniref:nucleotidyltransferase domain-containing protein n=1 Tax=Cetobacterium sp. TaxID=2071632 RepID=UPI003F3320EF